MSYRLQAQASSRVASLAAAKERDAAVSGLDVIARRAGVHLQVASTVPDLGSLRLRQATGHDNGWLIWLPAIGPHGFAVQLCRSEYGLHGRFGHLEQEFDSLDVAMMWVERALSPNYQLRTLLKGGKAFEWRLEPVTPGSPSDVLAMGFVSLFPRFGMASTIIQRNGLPPDEQSAASAR